MLAYDDRGSGAPIVFVHGLTFSRATWRPVVERLVDRHRCISVDLPGHGDSPFDPATAGSMDDGVAVLQETLATLGADRPVVVGHSMAGLLVSVYAARHPVAGVANVDQPLLLAPFASLLQRLGPALRGEQFEQAFEPFRQSIGVEALPEPMRSQVAATQTVRQDVVLAYWSQPMTTPADELQTWLDGYLDRIEVPYLAVFGNELPAPVRDHLRSHLRGLELEEWPGQGHLVHLADPDRFARRLATFADEVTRAI